jgi:23S rRNA (uracil1939-C5)-methyltransferase
MRLTIEKIVYGGNGLAYQSSPDSAGAVFVPLTLPGEVVEARITKQAANFSDAELDGVIQASQSRVRPRCVHFGACGGCQYQHASYATQLELKKEILQETLERAGLDAMPSIEVKAADSWEYRNRIRLRVAEFDGRIRVGYLRRGSAEFLPVQMCPIAAPLLWRAADALIKVTGDASSWVSATEEVEFFATPDEKALQMTIFVRREVKDFVGFCETLQKQLPELAGAGVAVIENSGRGRKVQRVRAGSTWGASGVNYIVRDESYWISRGGFFQVNRYVVELLVDLVTKGRSGHLAWDLYAGVGLFSQILARTFDEVIAVEAAAEDLLRSFRGKGRRAIASTTVTFLRQAALERERPELVVVDPPRAGLGSEVCSLLTRIKPGEIVYVSCDPATLGRDLRTMVDSGYKLQNLQMVDMFPQTFHQETVAVLRR